MKMGCYFSSEIRKSYPTIGVYNLNLFSPLSGGRERETGQSEGNRMESKVLTPV